MLSFLKKSVKIRLIRVIRGQLKRTLRADQHEPRRPSSLRAMTIRWISLVPS